MIELDSQFETGVPQLTPEQYAAIHLRVPRSGTPWLDDMIREAQRNALAARAMKKQPLFPQNLWHAIRWAIGLNFNTAKFNFSDRAEVAYASADAMLAAMEKSDGK